MRGFIVLLFILGGAGEHDPDYPPRETCNMEGNERTWGAHNVLPNLYRYVYRPFLDSFTYVATCPSDDIPVACDDNGRGPLWERCRYIEFDSLLSHYALLAQHVFGWAPLSSRTLAVTAKCNVITSKSASNDHECLRATLAYQCVWANAVWVALPLAAGLLVGGVALVMTCCSFAMYAME